MRALRLAIPLVFALGLTGCGSDAKVVTMPDVTSKKLDVAYDKIKAAGFEDKDKIDVKGGGLFGIVVESNCTVCEQSHAAGKTVTGPPKLTVNRSCKKPEAEPSAKPTPTPTPTASKPPEILTAKNSPEFDAPGR